MPYIEYAVQNDDGSVSCGPVDIDGNIVKRTKSDHPYAYDSFVQERCGDNSEINGSCYSDRLLQDNYDLTRKLIKKHFADTGIDVGGDYWSNRSADSIQGFLRERLGKPNLRVIVVLECCNQATGYPLWFFGYNA